MRFETFFTVNKPNFQGTNEKKMESSFKFSEGLLCYLFFLLKLPSRSLLNKLSMEDRSTKSNKQLSNYKNIVISEKRLLQNSFFLDPFS